MNKTTDNYIPAAGDHVIYETPETTGGHHEGNIIETKNGLVIKPVNKDLLTFGVSEVYVSKFRRFVKTGNFSQQIQYVNNTYKKRISRATLRKICKKYGIEVPQLNDSADASYAQYEKYVANKKRINSPFNVVNRQTKHLKGV